MPLLGQRLSACNKFSIEKLTGRLFLLCRKNAIAMEEVHIFWNIQSVIAFSCGWINMCAMIRCKCNDMAFVLPLPTGSFSDLLKIPNMSS